ncbi:MAG TPA: hypothetical protein PKY87_12805 [Terricaulis sp.]|nr:hypothetical protein [Terricaulis sp.]
MIIGEYPCCDGHLFIPLPDGISLPAYEREKCPHCGAVVWHKHSRIDPESWTEAAFLAEHNVDEETKQITRKDGR